MPFLFPFFFKKKKKGIEKLVQHDSFRVKRKKEEENVKRHHKIGILSNSF
jgi:hypothetical protein